MLKYRKFVQPLAEDIVEDGPPEPQFRTEQPLIFEQDISMG